MGMREIICFRRAGAMILALTCLSACSGDDETESGSSATTEKDSGGKAESSESDGSSEGTSDSDGGAGDADNPLALAVECTKSAPTEPVICGEATCMSPATGMTAFMYPCVYACCATKNGQEVCGGEDATKDKEIACQPIPPVEDSRCPSVSRPEGTGTVGTGGSAGTEGEAGAAGSAETEGVRASSYPGCCTPDNRCGVISSIRGLCITQSDIIQLPETPKACDAE